MTENIKEILIKELGKPSKDEEEFIIQDLNTGFLKQEISNMANKQKSKVFFGSTTGLLALACMGLIAWSFHRAGASVNLVIVWLLCIVVAFTAGYEWINLNRKTLIYKLLIELKKSDEPQTPETSKE